MNDDDRWLSQVRPADWRNPTPARSYDLVVVGGGTAGLVCAAGAAGLGARVALVEQHRLGGDCLNTGCVPSKSLLRSARAAYEAHTAPSTGVTGDRTDFPAVMARLRARRADLAPHDSAARLASLGVDVFFGRAAFSGPRSVGLRPTAGGSGDSELRFRKAVIATGSRPAMPLISGLAGTPFLTSENLFELKEQPKELAVIGAGATGCETAQAFARLGTRVTLFEAAPQILPDVEDDAAAVVAARLTDEGVALYRSTSITAARYRDGRFSLEHGGTTTSADSVLAATGRVACVDSLGLDAAGVVTGADGIAVDDHLRTSNGRVYAAGDVCSVIRSTHLADAMARIVIQNALFFGRRRRSALIVPSCVFTSPEVAHVGFVGTDASSSGLEAITIPMSEVDRAVVDEAAGGFLRLYHRRGRLMGATIVAPEAGELVGTVAFAMHNANGLADLASVVFPYPTLSLAFRQAGDAYRRAAVTRPVRRLLRLYFGAFR